MGNFSFFLHSNLRNINFAKDYRYIAIAKVLYKQD